MIVFNVGAYKNGSTWLEYIVRFPTGIPFVPTSTLDPAQIDLPDIQASEGVVENVKRIIKFNLQQNDPSIFYTKIHFRSTNFNVFRSVPNIENIKFVNIKRYLGDVIVSRYYHDLTGRYIGTFEEYFQEKCVEIVREYFLYHDFWNKVKNANIHTVSYEKLHTEFVHESEKLFSFLEITGIDLIKLQSDTSFEKQKQNYVKPFMKEWKKKGQNFYRNGRLGDWDRHATKEMKMNLKTMIDKYKSF